MKHLSGQDFVLWNPQERRFNGGRGHFTTLKSAQDFINRRVAPEITLLVDELTRYFGVIGMHEVCKSCFAGTLRKTHPDSRKYSSGSYGPGVGCCSPCGLQGHNACLSKPLGCATWMCNFTSDKFPQAATLLSAIKKRLYEARWKSPRFGDMSVMHFFTDIRPEVLSKEAREIVLWAIARIRKARFQARKAAA